jgi:hypothetical protein
LELCWSAGKPGVAVSSIKMRFECMFVTSTFIAHSQQQRHG